LPGEIDSGGFAFHRGIGGDDHLVDLITLDAAHQVRDA
jgi:hypothetical protein